MKRKIFLGTLFSISALWTSSLIAISLLFPWSWSRMAVIAYAVCILLVSFVRYRRCGSDIQQVIVDSSLSPGYVGEKEFLRIMDVALSQVFFFIVIFLPRPWIISNYVIVGLVGGAWFAFLRKDVGSRAKKKKPSLRKIGGPLPLITKK